MNLVECPADGDLQRFLDVPRGLTDRAGPGRVHRDEDVRAALHDAARRGDLACWVVTDGGRDGGRVAAWSGAGDLDQPGRAGFFECIDDQRVATTLLDGAAAWLGARGRSGMDAPVNFGERDRFWGTLVRGFDDVVYLENHNPPYHRRLLETWGLRPYLEGTTWLLPLASPGFGPFASRAEAAAERFGVRVSCPTPETAAAFAAAAHAVYTSGFQAGRPQQAALDEIRAMVAGLLAHGQPDLAQVAWIGAAPVGLLGAVPDLAEAARPGGEQRARLFVSATHPDHRKHGVYAALVTAMRRALAGRGMTQVVVAGVGGHTRNVVRYTQALGGRLLQVHVAFRRWFDGRPVAPRPMYTEEGLHQGPMPAAPAVDKPQRES